jgi:hypothetical protein
MAEEPAQEAASSGGLGGILGKITDAFTGGGQTAGKGDGKGKGRQPMSITEMVIRSAAQNMARSLGTQIAREGGRILRNQMGGIIGGGRTRATRAAGRGGGDAFLGEMSDLLGNGGRSSR